MDGGAEIVVVVAGRAKWLWCGSARSPLGSRAVNRLRRPLLCELIRAAHGLQPWFSRQQHTAAPQRGRCERCWVPPGRAWQGPRRTSAGRRGATAATRPVANAARKWSCMPPRSNSYRRRPMRSANSSSPGADEPLESPAALSHSGRSDSLSDMAGGGRRSGFEGEVERSSEYRLSLTRVCSWVVIYLWGLDWGCCGPGRRDGRAQAPPYPSHI